MWNLTSFCLETVLVSVQDSCMVCARRTIGLEIILDAPDGTTRRRGSSGSSFQSIWRLCKSSCKIGARFASNVPYARKSFWTHPTELLGEVVVWNLTSFHLETVLVSVQERCMVCARCTIGSKIVLDAPDGTIR